MNTENMTVETVNTLETRTTTSRRAECGGLTLTANVTETNGKVTHVGDISVSAENQQTLWTGHAGPNISGSFHVSGREVEVMELMTAFLGVINDNGNE